MPVIEVYEKLGKVHRLSGELAQAEVFANTSQVVEPLVKTHIVNLTQRLLDSIASADYDTYKYLCADDLTAFEAESRGNLVEGLGFHKLYFDAANAVDVSPAKNAMAQNHIVRPHVRLMGRSALIEYTRLVQTPGETLEFSETRVWERQNGQWKNVHFHRSRKE